MQNIKISIITPLYNREKMIVNAVYSIVNQIYSNWEMIIVDDGSADKSKAVVEELIKQDNRINLYIRENLPKGASTCRNIGISKAKGEYIIFLDSDDMLKDFALQQRMDEIIKNPNLDFLVFQTQDFQHNNSKEKIRLWNTITQEDNLIRFFKLDSVWHTSGAIWKAKTLKKYLSFDEKLLCWQDVDFHIQALMKNLQYKLFFNLPPDVLYRRHSFESISQAGFSKEQRLSQFYFLKKYLNQNINEEHLQILKKLYKKIMMKNIENRYFCNAVRMKLWQLINL